MATSPGGVGLGDVLVGELVAGPPRPVPVGSPVWSMNRDDPVEDHAVEVALVGQEHEAVHRDRRRLGVSAMVNVPAVVSTVAV